MTLDDFIRANEARLGTAEQAIEFVLDHNDFDMHQFLDDWRTGVVAMSEEYAAYHEWLEQRRNEPRR